MAADCAKLTAENEIVMQIAFIGFGETGQTISRGLLAAPRLGSRKTQDRAELIRVIREALGRGDVPSASG